MMITWKNLQGTSHDIFDVNSILYSVNCYLNSFPYQHIAMHKMSHDDNRKSKCSVSKLVN